MGFTAGTAAFSWTGPFAPVFGLGVGYLTTTAAVAEYDDAVTTTPTEIIDGMIWDGLHVDSRWSDEELQALYFIRGELSG